MHYNFCENTIVYWIQIVGPFFENWFHTCGESHMWKLVTLECTTFVTCTNMFTTSLAKKTVTIQHQCVCVRVYVHYVCPVLLTWRTYWAADSIIWVCRQWIGAHWWCFTVYRIASDFKGAMKEQMNNNNVRIEIHCYVRIFTKCFFMLQ